jgi:TonB family protein
MTIFSWKTLLAAVLAVAPLRAAAQAPDSAAAGPSCAEHGIRRLVVMVPPGRTPDEIRTLAAEGQLAPAGTEVLVVLPGEFTALRNERRFNDRMTSLLYTFMRQGTQVDGTVSFLIQLDDRGAVTSVHPNTGNRQVDRQLERAWKTAEFEPYTIGGCRVPAWIQVPLAFRSDYSLTEKRMNVGAPKP